MGSNWKGRLRSEVASPRTEGKSSREWCQVENVFQREDWDQHCQMHMNNQSGSSWMAPLNQHSKET